MKPAHYHWLALALLALSGVGMTFSPGAPAGWAFHPAEAFGPAWWRWLSAHLVHITPQHLGSNLLALLLLTCWATQRRQTATLLPVLLLSALAVDAGLLLFGPPLAWYAGMSGALHGVFAWLAWPAPGADGRSLRWLPWLAGMAKLGFDLSGDLQWEGFQPVPPAHVYGFACGTVLAALLHHRR